MGIWSFTKLAVAIVVVSAVGFEARASGTEQAQGLEVDVAVVFAVDFSSSIDPATADLQRNGHAAALTSPEIIKALSSGPRGCIAISYFEWASPQSIRPILPWTRICGPKDAEAAAGIIRSRGDRGFSRRIRGGTSISSAIGVGSLLLDRFPGHADRMVIDISGNGENNDGMPVQQARARAIDKGYTINAIAVPSKEFQNHDRSLGSYFAEEVIGGDQAFVIVPKQSSDYTTALRRKLVTEISWKLAPNSYPQGKQPRMIAAGARLVRGVGASHPESPCHARSVVRSDMLTRTVRAKNISRILQAEPEYPDSNPSGFHEFPATLRLAELSLLSRSSCI